MRVDPFEDGVQQVTGFATMESRNGHWLTKTKHHEIPFVCFSAIAVNLVGNNNYWA